MSGQGAGHPDDVPEEFAEAYRAAYEAAMAAQSVPEPGREKRPGTHAVEEEPDDESDDESGLPRRTRPIAVGTHRYEEEYDDPTLVQRITDSGWLVPVLLAVLVVMLLGGAYAVGRAFSGRVAGGGSGGEEPRVVMSEGGSPDKKQPVVQQQAGDDAWDGDVSPIEGIRARARCTSEAGVDAAGEPVTYKAANLVDGAADTTWRCDGSAVGEKLTFRLGDEVEVGEVGLIPGYAKTDEVDGTDRYAENNRVTKVRWTLGETVVEQTFGAAADDRSVRLLRVPETATRVVTLEILAVKKGPRDITAISEVQISSTS